MDFDEELDVIEIGYLSFFIEEMFYFIYVWKANQPPDLTTKF